MKKLQKVLAVLLTLALIFSLTACGGNNQSSAPASSAPASSATESKTESKTESSEAPTESEPPAPSNGPEDYTTDVGTPRSETLIVECEMVTDCPGQFNPFMSGTSTGFGVHQCLTAVLWEMDTVSGEQFGEVAESVESNADFTEYIVHLRKGIKWSDGEDLNADDVVYSFNLILTDTNISANTYANQVFKSVEKVDDYTVKFTMNYSFPRLKSQFGVTIYGTSYKIVPEHIYSQQAEVTQFKDENPVTAGPYTVKAYDPTGSWVLYERREDWMQSAMGVAGAAVYGYNESTPPPKYAWWRYLGDDAVRQMEMIDNRMDCMFDVTPEMITTMKEQNPNVTSWYSEYPYATSDDPCSQGLAFSMGQGAPYNDPNFRWGLAIGLDFDQISENTFDGIGRASPFAMLTNTHAMQELYYKPLLDWVSEFELDLGDGTTFKPWDPDYKYRAAERARAKGYDIPDDDDALDDMFGVGCWKHDMEAAEKLFAKAGLEKINGIWCFEGQPLKIDLNYTDDAAQCKRDTEAAYNQMKAMGFDVTVANLTPTVRGTAGQTGEFTIRGDWPTGGITKDLYGVISGWANDLIVPIGEIGSGQGSRWDNQEATDLIHEIAQLDPDSEENYEKCKEFMKIAIADMCFLPFHSGVKFVPSNNTYWTNWPGAENQYNGPWWWWSCFKYIMPNLKSTIA